MPSEVHTLLASGTIKNSR